VLAGIGVRGSIWARVFIVGAGAAGGVSGPCAKTRELVAARARSVFTGRESGGLI
jgi:hypothetical protein